MNAEAVGPSRHVFRLEVVRRKHNGYPETYSLRNFVAPFPRCCACKLQHAVTLESSCCTTPAVESSRFVPFFFFFLLYCFDILSSIKGKSLLALVALNGNWLLEVNVLNSLLCIYAPSKNGKLPTLNSRCAVLPHRKH